MCVKCQNKEIQYNHLSIQGTKPASTDCKHHNMYDKNQTQQQYNGSEG